MYSIKGSETGGYDAFITNVPYRRKIQPNPTLFPTVGYQGGKNNIYPKAENPALSVPISDGRRIRRDGKILAGGYIQIFMNLY